MADISISTLWSAHTPVFIQNVADVSQAGRAGTSWTIPDGEDELTDVSESGSRC
jgi:hypothetical protein